VDTGTEDPTELKRKVEALLFMSPDPLSLQKLAALVGVPPLKHNLVKECADQLREEYAAKGGAIEIAVEGNAYVMKVKDEYTGLVSKVAKVLELSKGELKTLALIAKKEGKTGVLQSAVVKALGAGCYDHIHSLIEQNFINRRKSGRSWLLNTTPKFKEYFKVNFDADRERN